MAHNVKAEEISKCTQECPQELPEQGACESRVQGYRNKEISLCVRIVVSEAQKFLW